VAKKKAGEQPRLLEAARRRPDEPAARGPYAANVTTDPSVTEYLASLQPSNCPECGKPQQTPRGESMVCPRCEKGLTLSKQRASVARTESAAGRKGR